MRPALLCIVFGFPLIADNSVTITDLTGTTQTDRPITISRVFKKGEIAGYPQPRVDGTPASTWQADVKTTWSDGTVCHAIVSLKATIAASSSITVDFVNDSNPCSSGNRAACDAASLDQSGMTGFLSGNWDAQISATAGDVTHTVSAKTMIGDGKWSYWLRGPVVTAVKVEDASTALSYDFGWDCLSNCTGDHSTATWQDASTDTNKSVHPQFYVVFYAGWNGVGTSFVLENVWDKRAQDLYYTVEYKTGSPLSTAYGPQTAYQWCRTRWHQRDLWSGEKPGKVKIDFNRAYLSESRVIPNYDPSVTVGSTAIADSTNKWASSDKGQAFHSWVSGTTHLSGLIVQDMYPTGVAWGERGLFPTWATRYLYTFHTTLAGGDLYDIVLGNGNVSGYIPIHRRHATAAAYYCAQSQLCIDGGLDTVTTMGKPMSRDAYATFGAFWSPVREVGGKSTYYWSVDFPHYPELAFIPYLITGEPYFLEELQFVGAAMVFVGKADGVDSCPYNDDNCGRNSWGYIPRQSTGARAVAWGLRGLGMAAFFSPDGTPERAYFRQKVYNNIAIREGTLNLTDGYGYANDTTKWTWGKNYGSYINAKGTYVPNPLGFINYDWSATLDETNTSKTYKVDSPWMEGYVHIVLEHMSGLGFPEWDTYRKAIAYRAINMVLDTEHCVPWTAGNYRWPVISLSTGKYFTTMADVCDAVSDAAKAYTQWMHGPCDAEGGYAVIALGAAGAMAEFTAGSYSGADAYAWVYSHINQSCLAGNPKWAILPRSTPSPDPPEIITTELSPGFVGSAYSQTVSGIKGTPPYSWDLSAGSLCSGLSLNSSTGAITGTPTTPQTCNFTVRLTDALSDTDTQDLSIAISAAATISLEVGGTMQVRGVTIK